MQLTPEQQDQVRQARTDGETRVVVEFSAEQSNAWQQAVKQELGGKEENIAHFRKIKAAAEQPGFFGDIRRAILLSRRPLDELAASIGADPRLLSDFRAGEAELSPIVLDRLVTALGLRLMQEIPALSRHNCMNAEPLLNRIAKVFADHRLEVVMVGNAAAALHGAPVTTLDVDFMFRKTPTNLKKLKAVAASLGAVILRPFHRASDMHRVVNDDRGMQLDFMPKLDGIRSFEGLRDRATAVEFGEHELKIACLADVIKSKRAANRDRDRAVLDILERTFDEQEKSKS